MGVVVSCLAVSDVLEGAEIEQPGGVEEPDNNNQEEEVGVVPEVEEMEEQPPPLEEVEDRAREEILGNDGLPLRRYPRQVVEMVFRCEFCPRTFSSRIGLSAHKANRHPFRCLFDLLRG